MFPSVWLLFRVRQRDLRLKKCSPWVCRWESCPFFLQENSHPRDEVESSKHKGRIFRVLSSPWPIRRWRSPQKPTGSWDIRSRNYATFKEYIRVNGSSFAISFFLPLSLSLSSPPSLYVNLKGEFWEILDDTCLVSPTPNSTNPTTLILPFYKFPFVRRISVTGFQARPLTGEKAATLNGNLITNDELLMIDGTQKNKNTAGCYRIFVFFSLLPFCVHTSLGEKLPRFLPLTYFSFFSSFESTCFFFLSFFACGEISSAFQKIEGSAGKKRKPIVRNNQRIMHFDETSNILQAIGNPVVIIYSGKFLRMNVTLLKNASKVIYIFFWQKSVTVINTLQKFTSLIQVHRYDVTWFKKMV